MYNSRIGAFLVRVVLLGLLWWVLTGGESDSWLLGGPVILFLAAWRLSESVAVRGRFRPWRLVSFVPYFVWRSLVGSCDVAWRAVHRRLPISPAVWSFTFRLPEGPARVVCTNCINMLPGTLTAAWDGDVLRIHLLVAGPRPLRELRQLEDRVGLLFGHELPAAIDEVEA